MTLRAALDERCSCEEISLKSQASHSLCYQRAAPCSPTFWIIFSWHYNSVYTWQRCFLPQNLISVHLICSSFCFLIICKTCCVPLHPFLTLYSFIEELAENEKSRCISSYESAQVQFSSFPFFKIFLIINRSWLQFSGKWIQNMMINVCRIIPWMIKGGDFLFSGVQRADSFSSM